MRWLLDTNFISELRKGTRSNRGVQSWAAAHDPRQCALSVMTIGEIRVGIERCRKRDLTQAQALEGWLARQMEEFADQILPITLTIANRWGHLMSASDSSDVDLLIAATALEHDLTVVTRNVSDFQSSGVRLHNPWK